MSGKITIKNQKGPLAVIDIEGVIGVPEHWQFEEPGERVATYEAFREAVAGLDEVRSPEIVVNIRSTGGNVNDALLIYDKLAAMDARVTTRCYGYVASAATIIAQAASQGCREVSANSLYLIHKSVSAAEGNTSDLSKTLGMLEQTDRRIAEVYAARGGRTVEQFAELMCENDGNGRWLSPEEVLASGLADRIIAGTSIPKEARQAVLNMGLPPVPQQEKQGRAYLSKKWNAILEVLGIAGDKDAEQAAAAVEKVQAAERTIESMATAQVELGDAHRREVAELRNRIDTLESQNARLMAAATSTKPKEDPSPQEVRRSPNEEAYLADLHRFV
ncbi:Clp protease ClpP [Alistipes sp. OttesenSCG-928-B03]|nr:Clp protease ClpP [Alistipes sp. OttesenSCG-928-B03]